MAKRKHGKSKIHTRSKKHSGSSTNRKQAKDKANKVQEERSNKKKLQDDLYKLFLEEEKKRKGAIPKKNKLAEELYKLIIEEERKIQEPKKTVRKKKPVSKREQDFYEPLPGESVNKYEERTGIQVSDIPEEKLRYKGKFISEEFEKIVRAAAGASKKSAKDLLTDPANQKALDNILNKNKAEAYKTANTIIDKISGRGTIEVTDGNETWYLTSNEAIQRIVTFDTRVKRMENGVVYVGILITEYLDGRTVIYLPKKRASTEEVEEFLNDYTEYLIYDN